MYIQNCLLLYVILLVNSTVLNSVAWILKQMSAKSMYNTHIISLLSKNMQQIIVCLIGLAITCHKHVLCYTDQGMV